MRLRSVCSAFLVLAAFACDASVDVRPRKPGGGDGGSAIDPTGGGGGRGGFGGAGGVGGEGGGPCELGTPCDPIQIGQRFLSEGDESATAVAISTSGDLFVGGHFDDRLELGSEGFVSAGSRDAFVARLDGLDGEPLWTRAFGSSERDETTDVVATEDGGVVATGHARGIIDFGGGERCSGRSREAFLAKLDAGGRHQWSRCFGSWVATRTVVAAGPDGAIVLAGESVDDIDLGTGVLSSEDGGLFVAKYDLDGQAIWARRLGGYESSVHPGAGAVDADGNVFVAIRMSGTMELDGSTFTSVGSELLLIKLGPAGSFLWARGLRGDPSSNMGLGVRKDGVAIVGGRRFDAVFDETGETPHSGMVAAFASDGTLVWTRDLGGTTTSVVGIDSADDGSALILANAPPTLTQGWNDVLFYALTPDGSELFSRSFGSGHAASVDAKGDAVALAGGAYAEMDFGAGPLTGAESATDAFVALFDPWQSAAPR